jgi:hypothetical protein
VKDDINLAIGFATSVVIAIPAKNASPVGSMIEKP